ncbi:MAG: hypothetical protein ACK5HR_04015 [Mycoplasmatales bacterium]
MKKKYLKKIKGLSFLISLIILIISSIILITGLISNVSSYSVSLNKDKFVPKIEIGKLSAKVQVKEDLSKINTIKIEGAVPNVVTLKIKDKQPSNNLSTSFFGSYEIQNKVLIITREKSLQENFITNNNLDLIISLTADLPDITNTSNYAVEGIVDTEGYINILDPLINSGNKIKIEDYIKNLQTGLIQEDKINDKLTSAITSNKIYLEKKKDNSVDTESFESFIYVICNTYDCKEINITDQELSTDLIYRRDYNNYNNSNDYLLYDYTYCYLLLVNDGLGYDYKLTNDKLIISDTNSNKSWNIKIKEVKNEDIY